MKGRPTKIGGVSLAELRREAKRVLGQHSFYERYHGTPFYEVSITRFWRLSLNWTERHVFRIRAKALAWLKAQPDLAPKA